MALMLRIVFLLLVATALACGEGDNPSAKKRPGAKRVGKTQPKKVKAPLRLFDGFERLMSHKALTQVSARMGATTCKRYPNGLACKYHADGVDGRAEVRIARSKILNVLIALPLGNDRSVAEKLANTMVHKLRGYGALKPWDKSNATIAIAFDRLSGAAKGPAMFRKERGTNQKMVPFNFVDQRTGRVALKVAREQPAGPYFLDVMWAPPTFAAHHSNVLAVTVPGFKKAWGKGASVTLKPVEDKSPTKWYVVISATSCRACPSVVAADWQKRNADVRAEYLGRGDGNPGNILEFEQVKIGALSGLGRYQRSSVRGRRGLNRVHAYQVVLNKNRRQVTISAERNYFASGLVSATPIPRDVLKKAAISVAGRVALRL